MIVDIISKASLDTGSTPASSTPMCRQRTLTRHVRAVPGLTGFDSLRVWVREIVTASKMANQSTCFRSFQGMQRRPLTGVRYPRFY